MKWKTNYRELKTISRRAAEQNTMRKSRNSWNILLMKMEQPATRGCGGYGKRYFLNHLNNSQGKKDKEGDLITNPDKLKEIYLDAYTERLKHRVMVPELLKLKTLREELFQQRLQLAKKNRSPDWTVEDLDKVLVRLKDEKASDLTGLVNELFSSKNIGSDLLR